MCPAACRLIVVGTVSGVPAGKPRPGSIGSTPAAIMPAPLIRISRGAHFPSAVPAPISNSTPPTTKLAICNQPSEPVLSRLSGCFSRSKPSRPATWASETVAQSGPAAASAARPAEKAGVRVTAAEVIVRSFVGSSAPASALTM